jgi:serine phosphatase RsbU (regulator of sigma subunit)
MPFLTITSGQQMGQRLELSRDEFVIGRDPKSDLVVDVGAISRRHARIARQGHEFLLEDMGSRNGTYLNNEMLDAHKPRALKEGDRLRICDIEYTFHKQQGLPPSAFAVPEAMTSDGSHLQILMTDDPIAPGTGSSRWGSPGDSGSRSGTVQITCSPETKLAAILKISKNLGRSLLLDDVLPNVLKTLFEIMPQADRGFIVLAQPDGSLVTRWSHTRRDQDSETVRVSRTIIRKVMESGEPMISEDASQDSKFDVSASVADLRIRSMICAPLLDSEGKAVGALQIDSLNYRFRFSGEDLDLLASVAAQAGIAIRNSQLHEQAVEQAEAQRDLQRAREVQQAFLPNGPPRVDGFRFFSFYQPAQSIGGDYYDYIPLSHGRTAVVVADVVGHGVAAAMFMAKLSAECRFCLANEADVAMAITRLNEQLSGLAVDRFITLLVTVLDPAERTMTIVNAGHMAPLILQKSGELIEPGEEEAGVPIGVDPDWKYESVTVDLHPGDSVVLFTDGINESMNLAGQLFGIDRIRGHMAEGGDPEALGRRIISAVNQFVGTGPQLDDMCLVVLNRADVMPA